MAMYFQGSASEIQPHDVQTLYLMNPAASYQANNMVFLNNPLSSSIPQQHYVGIPLQPSQDSHSSPYNNNNNNSSNNNIWTVPSNASNANSVEVRPNNTVSVAQQGLSLSLSSSSNGGMQSVLMGSKYLMAAQQLLDEVVNVGMKGSNDVTKRERTRSSDKDLDQGGDGDGSGKKMGSDLSTAERQEIQMKKAKLVNMLDEVEQRYRQYHHQMQIVVSSFEAVAGFGSARSYTALALQTISKQFRCLRDAISAQIRAASKSLGEEDCLDNGGGKSMGSRLRFVDHHLRQQRALQQLGMIQNNAWRPQRGLPERAVSVLRAWLFEHFLHPYPKDSDKHMLAKQTGLTRSQVSNWFINARVRLWKPMVEEMYLEETKEQEQNNGGDDKRSKSEASESTSQQANTSTPPAAERHESFKSMQNNTLNTPKPQPNIAVHPSNLGMSDELIMQQRVKKIRSEHSIHQNTIIPNQMTMDIKPDELSNRELLMKFMDQGTGFGAYPIGEIGQFDHEQFAPRFGGNGVSLTLGLPHCETLSLSGSQQPSFLSNESIPLENNYFSLNNNNSNNPSSSHPPNGYESINIQNRKRFAAQLLPDFVA